jgi:hypothetical protein
MLSRIMDFMSRSILSVYLLILLCFSHSFCCGIDEFPLTNTILYENYENVDKLILTNHVVLKQAASKDESKDKKANFFKCGFQFKVRLKSSAEEYRTSLFGVHDLFTSGAEEISQEHQLTLTGIHSRFYEVAKAGKHNISANLIAAILI